MLWSVCTFVCLLTLFHAPVCSSYNQGKTRRSDEVKEVRDHSLDTRRWARSTIGIWPAVIRALLKEAKEVPTKSEKYRKYLKVGTQVKARRDFVSLKPIYPKGKKFFYKGVVGDVKVKFRWSDVSQKRHPSIQFTDPDSGESVKIVYVKTEQ